MRQDRVNLFTFCCYYLIFISAMILLLPLNGLSSCNQDTPQKNAHSIYLWGTATINNGPDIAIGDAIRAYSKDVEINNGCVGLFYIKDIINDTVNYGAMNIYGDDPTTETIKDGAANDPNSPIYFVLCHDGEEYHSTESLVWTEDKDLIRLDLTFNISQSCHQTFILQLNPGFNLIALPPFDPFFDQNCDGQVIVYTAHRLLEDIPQIKKIYRWDAGWKVYSHEGAVYSGTDFDLEHGKGYFAYVTENEEYPFFGDLLKESIDLTLNMGFSLVSFFEPGRELYARTVLSESGCSKIYNWSAGWKVCTSDAGDNFLIEHGKGYFLYCSSGSTWPALQ